MKTLTIIAATLYALLLWLFAPQKIWDVEVKKAKSKLNKPTLETPLKQLETPQKPKIVEDTKTTETTETATQPQTWTVAQLRKEAQNRKIQWKDNNGKPLKKSELMRILEV